MTDQDSEADAKPGTPDGVDRSLPAEALSQLFQEVILDHYRSPKNKRGMEDATHSVTMDNPLCGDVIELNLRVEDDRIEDVSFQGQGCSISQAAASMLTRELEGRSVREARELDEKFTRLMHGDDEHEDDSDLGELRALSGVSKFPVRVKCALLGFNCLEELIGEDGGDEASGTR